MSTSDFSSPLSHMPTPSRIPAPSYTLSRSASTISRTTTLSHSASTPSLTSTPSRLSTNPQFHTTPSRIPRAPTTPRLNSPVDLAKRKADLEKLAEAVKAELAVRICRTGRLVDARY